MAVFTSSYNDYAAKYASVMISSNKSNSIGNVATKGGNENVSDSISDKLQLSPQTAIKSVIAEFKQSNASNLTINLTVKANNSFASANTQQRITDSADKLIRMLSHDDGEYQSLMSSFKEFFGKASSEFSDTPSEKEIANLGFKGDASVSIQEKSEEVKISKGAMAGATIKYSSYKITMSFSNSENTEASDSKSIANSFTEALANFFGYKNNSSRKTSSKENDSYTPTSQREAEIMRKAQVIDAFSSNSVKITSNSLKASLKEASTNSVSASINHSSAATNHSSVSVSASSSATNAVKSASSSYQRLQELKLQGCDPIVLDLSGEGINLTEAGKGGKFDINADGIMDSTGWVSGNTAMLVYDKNGNNIIDNGSELFGDQNGASDGYAELAKYDDNKDGKIDKKDAIFKNLKLYRDLNGDGLMSDDEFNTLEEMGIKSLSLNATAVDENVNGNSIVLSGSFEREDGTTGKMADAIFGYSEL